MPRISYATIQKKYKGMYVLTDGYKGEFIAASKNLGKAFKQAEKKGYKLPTVEFIEPAGLAIYEVDFSLPR
jgi:hypothetical protein